MLVNAMGGEVGLQIAGSIDTRKVIGRRGTLLYIIFEFSRSSVDVQLAPSKKRESSEKRGKENKIITHLCSQNHHNNRKLMLRRSALE